MSLPIHNGDEHVSAVQYHRLGLRPRRGAVSVAGILLIVMTVLIAILVADAAYLISINRGMADVTSIMALAGAPELLDPNLLQDAAGPPVANQTASRASAAAVADAYRQRNNGVLPAHQQLNASDVVIQTGFVNDVTADPLVLDTLAAEHNTVYVYAARTTSGSHPVKYPVDLSGSKRAIEIRGGAFATLDNLVVGFRPEAEMAAPLVPLGILTSSFSSERTEDTNGDGTKEMVVRLQTNNPPPAPQYPPQSNSALLCYAGTLSADVLSQTMPLQVAQGVFPADLPPTGVFGPATSSSLVNVIATQMGDGANPGTAAIVSAFNAIAGQKRVFPLIQQMANVAPDGSGTAQVEGFVACTVLSAAIIDNRLTVRVEPCYLIHHTAWTVPPTSIAPAGVTRNPYIYKLRLCR